MPPSKSSAFAFWMFGRLSNSGLKRQRRPKKLAKAPRPLRKLHVSVERRRHSAFLRKLRRVHRYIGSKDFTKDTEERCTKEDTEERYNEIILVMHYFGWLLRMRIFDDDTFEPFVEIEIRGGGHVLIKVVQDGFNDDGTTWMEQSVKFAVRYGVKVTLHLVRMFIGFDLLMHSFKDLMKNVIALNNAHF